MENTAQVNHPVHKWVFKASARCRQMIKNEEGWKMAPYVCAAGKWTVGAGRRLYPDSKIPGLYYNSLLKRWFGKLTEPTAEKLLDEDIARCEKAILDLVDVPLNQNQFDALVIFIFNIGRNAFAGSTLLRYVDARLWGSAAKQMDRWVHDDDGNVIEGLVARQKRTRALFQTVAIALLLFFLSIVPPVSASEEERIETGISGYACKILNFPVYLPERSLYFVYRRTPLFWNHHVFGFDEPHMWTEAARSAYPCACTKLHLKKVANFLLLRKVKEDASDD